MALLDVAVRPEEEGYLIKMPGKKEGSTKSDQDRLWRVFSTPGCRGTEQGWYVSCEQAAAVKTHVALWLERLAN